MKRAFALRNWKWIARLQVVSLCFGLTIRLEAQSAAPALDVSNGGGSVTVSWPQTAYYFLLTGTSNLPPSTPWTPLASAAGLSSFCPTVWFGGTLATNVVGDQFTFTQPATGDAQYFRLEAMNCIPIFQFAIFYNQLLEFSGAGTMTVKGQVHANGPVYTGSASVLSLGKTITCTGTISAPTNNGNGYTFPGNVNFGGNPTYITNVPPLFPRGIGLNDAHLIIDMPPFGEDPNSFTGLARLYNHSHVIVLASNASVTMVLQLGTSDPAPYVSTVANTVPTISANFPFLTLTNTFYDQRERKTNLVTQIDVGQYATWLSTNLIVQAKFLFGAGTYPTILFVADNRTYNTNQLTVVRITNGIAPPHYGFTLVTPNPLYVWGNFNQTNAAFLNTTNTSDTVPCALMCDAITVLSPNWKDRGSTGPFNAYQTNDAANTTVNAAFLTGTVPSTGSGNTQFSGGVHNLPRLLEDWVNVSGGQRTLTINGSFVCLFNSQRATALFRNPGAFGLANWPYYDPPVRQYNLDQNFADPTKLPPGTPMVGVSAP